MLLEKDCCTTLLLLLARHSTPTAKQWRTTHACGPTDSSSRAKTRREALNKQHT